MPRLPFYIVPLAHTDWEDAVACSKKLPREAMPEIRLDLLPDADPEHLVDSLKHRCIVSCRKQSDGGMWPDADEAGRLEKLKASMVARPHWIDLEWDSEIPAWLEAELMHTGLLRSYHAPHGLFDLDARLGKLPEGDAFKWVGRARRLSDNAKLIQPLSWARDHRIILSAFLMGNKGIASRCMQAAWGGSFTYAAPDKGHAVAPGQLPLQDMMAWKCHLLHSGYGICGVLGSPILQSPGPGFHNRQFRQSFKDLLYLPLEADSAEEALEAIENIPLLGASITMPLKESLPELLNIPAPVNTLWRRNGGNNWQWTNTDALALADCLGKLPGGAVMVLGSGGVAKASMAAVQKRGWPALQHSRRSPITASEVGQFAPVGVIQATSLGMMEDDPLPFPDILEAAAPTLRWAAQWVNRDGTAFCSWAESAGLQLVSGAELFEKQAALQSKIFISECGGSG